MAANVLRRFVTRLTDLLLKDPKETQQNQGEPEAITSVELDDRGNLVINKTHPFRIRDLRAIEIRHPLLSKGEVETGLVKVFLNSHDRSNREIFSNAAIRRSLVGQLQSESQQAHMLREHAQKLDVPVIEF